MEERLRFVARLLDGEGMSDVCRSFGISRKTGYKIFNRYKEQGFEALCDRSRRPVRYANQLPEPIEQMIARLKREKPHWGARKIRELLIRRLAGDVRIPATSTVHAVLDRRGLVKRGRRRRRNKAQGTAPSQAMAPNDLWCADFKGEFKLGNRQYCYPLTVTDQASRFVLLCEALDRPRKLVPLPPSCVCSKNVDCQTPSAPITACPSPAPTGSTTCRSYRSGGSASASPSNASSRDTPSKMAAMNACTSR
jgi:transposase InsO family protein